VIDWDDLRFFLAIARNGNLSAAAKDLHVAQSTVGRRLASLEASLGVRLLNRTPDGYVPTLAGDGVRGHAERLEAEALAMQRAVGGRDVRMAGLVRITCAETVATHILAPALAGLHREHPDIMIELTPNTRALSLSMREADIAVRLSRPNQHDLVIRRIGTMAFGLYAAADYLACHVGMDLADGCPGHHVITQSEDIEDGTQTGWLSGVTHRARVSVQTTSHEAAVTATVRGGGLACLARFRADREDRLVRLEIPPPVPRADIWLVIHKDNRHVPRIRAAINQITAYVGLMAPQLVPPDVGAVLGPPDTSTNNPADQA
jgi:DNA-binding transcriptional LysR family regulator